MTIVGKATDQDSGAPLPGATIALRSGFVTLVETAANDDGLFTISTNQVPDSILITSIGYTGQYWPLPEYESKSSYQLPKLVKQEPEVIITAVKKNSWLWLILVGIGIAVGQKKPKRTAKK